ncbi:TraB/GumN family protein [Acidovorax sp. GBBC 3334]|uniref:TraB/GumN family protein n=1 Tax=Acidovorax sp. GBBC 3334 TaxID=2940496 RepID=UPI0023040BA2|nr:TraB/GumN family protein [Acidovorax sp. GBBC 3334]MDA8455570.1 TraB/GumN family protein [Acidovorax sp. GBBC 3334]
MVRAAVLGRRAAACLWGLAVPVLAQPAPAPAAPASPPALQRADCPPVATPIDPAAIPQALREARDHGLLWRVEQGGRTSWLYGTVHAARRDWMLPGPTVLAAVQGSDRIALELDLLDPAVGAALQAAMRNPPGAAPLPPDLARRLAAQIDAACADPGLAALRPELQVASLVVMAARRDGIDPAYGIDLVLAGMARGLRKPVVSLESVELQVRALASDDPRETAAAVASGLEQLESSAARDALGTLARAWADGRANLLESYGQWCDCLHTLEEREGFERLVVGRNPGLARSIAAQHRAGHRVFAAVGALHMVGPQGLPALLARQGFRVERVQWPASPAAAPARGAPPSR